MSRIPPFSVAEWCSGNWDGVRPGIISGASIDSRTLKPGMLFFALVGEQVDGHKFVTHALRAGAAAAVVRSDFLAAPDHRGTLLRVDDPARALRYIARGYRQFVDADVIGITGSAGKTTVKEMTASILRQTYRTAQTPGNWNNDIGLPLSLLGMGEETQTAVIEMGTNHVGEIGDLCTIALPNFGMLTNIGPSHIENFGSLEAIAEEKGALLEALPDTGLAVLDRDDAMFDRLSARCAARVITVSTEDGDYVLQDRDPVSRVAHVCETATGDVFEFTPRLPGRFETKNAMFAIALARGMGMNWVDINDGLNAYRPQPMRWEMQSLRGATIINDAYNANPVSMCGAIDTFSELDSYGRKWLVLGGMLELGEHEREEHLKLGRHIAEYDWHRVVLIGRLGWIIAEGAVEGGLSEEQLCRCQSNDAAADLLVDDVHSGDAVLFKASRGLKLEEIQLAFENQA